MANEPDHLILRRYVLAHRRGDGEAAAREWQSLWTNNFDRVKQIVKAFRFSAGGSGLPPEEHGSAVSEAWIRVTAMGVNFRETETGQFYAALFTCVENTCRDYGRREFRHETRKEGSLDEPLEPGGETGRFDRALGAYDGYMRRQSEEAVEAEIRRLEAEGMVGWAIGQIENDNYREVLAMTYTEKVPAEEIAERLGITLDNVYARRSRGLKELEKILREHRS